MLCCYGLCNGKLMRNGHLLPFFRPSRVFFSLPLRDRQNHTAQAYGLKFMAVTCDLPPRLAWFLVWLGLQHQWPNNLRQNINSICLLHKPLYERTELTLSFLIFCMTIVQLCFQLLYTLIFNSLLK